MILGLKRCKLVRLIQGLWNIILSRSERGRLFSRGFCLNQGGIVLLLNLLFWDTEFLDLHLLQLVERFTQRIESFVDLGVPANPVGSAGHDVEGFYERL
jgi:hypothetical protein